MEFDASSVSPPTTYMASFITTLPWHLSGGKGGVVRDVHVSLSENVRVRKERRGEERKGEERRGCVSEEMRK